MAEKVINSQLELTTK